MTKGSSKHCLACVDNWPMEADTFKTRFAYALPAFALAIIGIPVYVYIPKFYTDVVGIDMAVAGLMLFGVRIFDALTDPIMGFVSDHTGRNIPAEPRTAGGVLQIQLQRKMWNL